MKTRRLRPFTLPTVTVAVLKSWVHYIELRSNQQPVFKDAPKLISAMRLFAL